MVFNELCGESVLEVVAHRSGRFLARFLYRVAKVCSGRLDVLLAYQ